MNSSELRTRFLAYFEKQGHTIVPSSSLLPTDPSVLFTTAGMQQFKSYYLGSESPYGKDVASCQKCIRTSDIDEVGDKSHLTFFEMLGNFSFGGYFKEKAIKLAFEFITKELKLEIEYVTVFSPDKVAEGDWRKNVQEDKESYKIWKDLGVKEEKIRKEGTDNFWGPTGQEGPCGPTTEIYVSGVEIWNIVFNEFFCDKDKNLKKLDPAGVDTGMGLERLAIMTENKETVFETDLFLSLIKEIEKISGARYKDNQKLFRIIADHIKSSVFLASDGVVPSNVEQGYILRRLIRRAVRYAKNLKMSDFVEPLVKIVVKTYEEIYPELKEKEDKIISVISQEERKFEKTLEKGLREIEKIDNLTGEKAFWIYETYGFPLELSEEIKEVKDRDRFFEELEKHQELSRTASAGMFKSGLADHSEATIKYHTATHLLLAGLRKVLGDHVFQKGSNITADRLRFDFSHNDKMTKEQIKEVENFVNGIIEQDLSVSLEEMSLDQAKEMGAMGVFESKYSDKVKVYTVGQGENIVSREICSGPHVERTGILGIFKIQKEESSSSGVRRIKAILE